VVCDREGRAGSQADVACALGDPAPYREHREPVRENATALLPIAALAVGGVAAGSKHFAARAAVGVIVTGVLAYVFLVQLYGEAMIVRAIRWWPRIREDRSAHKALLRFFSWIRFSINAGFLAAAATAFALGYFGKVCAFRIAVGVALALGAIVVTFAISSWWEARGRPAPS
jgi:hypothetical protein